MRLFKQTVLAIAATVMVTSQVVADTSEEDAMQALNVLNERFNQAAAAHDAEGLISLYSDAPVWIEAGKNPTVGLEGPSALFDFVTANKGLVTHTIDHLYVSDDSTLAVMIGSVVAKIESQGMDATGTYLFVLEPDDKDWEVVVDMWHQHTAEKDASESR